MNNLILKMSPLCLLIVCSFSGFFSCLTSSNGYSLEIRNQNLGFSFSDEDFTLLKINDYMNGIEFSLSPSPIWRLTLFDTSSGDLKVENFTPLMSTQSQGMKTYYFDNQGQEQYTCLHLIWDSIPVLNGGRVEVLITMDTSNPGNSGLIPGISFQRDNRQKFSFDDLCYSSKWEIQVVDYCDTLSVYSYDFPFLTIPSFTGNEETSRMAIPHMSGILVPNPIRNAGFRVALDRDIDNWGDEAHGKSPGMFGMQFAAIYDLFQDQKFHGLFFSTNDTTSTFKRYNYNGYYKPGVNNDGSNQPKTDDGQNVMTYFVRHFPLNHLNPGKINGKTSTPPYSVFILPFQGDFLDAAKIYRIWAEKQRWTSKGKLWNRKDFNKDLSEISCLININVEESAYAKETYESIKRLQNWIGTDVRLGLRLNSWYTNWPTEPVPKDSMDWLVRCFQDSLGARVFPYVHTRGWEQNQPDDEIHTRKKAAALNANGDCYVHQLYNFLIMDPACPDWRAKVFNMSAFVKTTLGASDVYLDNHQSYQMCYRQDSFHRHTKGPGNYWLKAFIKMMSDIRNGGKKKDIRYSMVQEGKMEELIPFIDSNLLLYWENNDFNGFYSDKGFPIPLFVAVYHDYLNSMGSIKMPWEEYARQQYQYTFTQGYSFIAGTRMTARDDKFLLRKDPEATPDDPEVLAKEYWKLLCGYHSILKNYLVYGEYLRPPLIVAPIVTVEFFKDWSRKFEAAEILPRGQDHQDSLQWNFNGYRKLLMSSVIGSAFLAPDSTLGIILTNYTDEDVYADIQIDLLNYGMQEGIHLVEKINREFPNYEFYDSFEGTLYSMQLEFPKRSAKAFRIFP